MTCGFIGHRDFDKNSEYEEVLKNYILNLIVDKKVDRFIFGSNSKFDSFCFSIVSDFQKTYTHIKLIAYHCKHELPYLKSEESKKQKTILFLKDIYSNTQFSFRLFDERYYFEEFDAGRNSYIKRNEKIIKDSDFLVFYYDPYNRTHGTRLMFDFANKKHKNVFNIFDKK